MESQINVWNAAHKREQSHKKEVHEEVKPLPELFKVSGVKKILDLGCGAGRHLVYFSQRGFTMSGLDFAAEAIRQSQEWLAEQGLNAELICNDMIRLPWADDIFDAVISIQSLEHNELSSIQKIIGEVHRVLRDGSFFFAVVKKYPPRKDWKKGKFTELDSHLYAPTEGPEKGIVHYFFTEGELHDMLTGFTINKIEEDKKQRHYCFLAQKVVTGA